MSERYYRTGQAAKQLEISSYHVRRLCEAGEIAAELTAGGQWRIPLAEIARLDKDGVPPVPMELEEETAEGEAADSFRQDQAGDDLEVIPEGLYAGPSSAVIEAAEQVKIVESKVKQRRLEREVEEVEDWFRERADRRASAAEAQRQKEAAAQAERRRYAWSELWIRHALDAVPSSAPREIELAVHSEVRATLQQMDGTGSDAVTRRLVDAATEKALSPWRQRENARKALETALSTMPFEMRHGAEFGALRQRAWESAIVAVGKMPGQPTPWEITTVGTQAMQPMVREYEHRKTCERTLGQLYIAGTSWEELREAKEAVRAVLTALPVGAGQKQIEQACESVIVPLKARIAQREETARREAEQQRLRRAAELKAVYQLSHIDFHLREEYEFDGGFAERCSEGARLRKVIEPQLVEDLIEDPDMTAEEIRERIEDLIEEYL